MAHIHRPGFRHTNVDALSRYPIGSAADDDDFGAKIQDIAGIPADEPKEDGELFCVKVKEETD